MSTELAPGEPTQQWEPAAVRRRSRWRLPLVLLLVAALVGTGLLALLVGHRQRSAAPTSQASSAAAAAHRRQVAVRNLLGRRSAAIEHHDRRALLATIDPTQRGFRRAQARMLADLRRVPVTGWTYTMDPRIDQPHLHRLDRYHVPTWAPASFSLHYRLRGFDSQPTDLPQYPTFTHRGGHWYLASLSDFSGIGDVSATDLWDYGPVSVVREGPALVLGPPQDLGLMRELAGQVRAAVPQVTAVWGRRWARRAVVLVPASERELGLVTGDAGDLHRIAALSSAEVHTARGAPAPVGARVSINPAVWSGMGPLGRQVVITHELTHVASRGDTGYRTPTWLVEGFADYVGFLRSGVATTAVAGELSRAVQAGRVPTRLPSDHVFTTGTAGLARAYEASWLACRYIAETYGSRRLVAFYRAVGLSPRAPGAAVATALHAVLGLTPSRFTHAWRTYVREQLG